MRIRFHRQARTTPDAIDGLKVPYAAAKRNAPKWRWRLILLVVLSPALMLAWTALHSVLTMSANGSVYMQQMEVRAPASGRIAAVPAQLGAELAQGDIIAQLEDPALDRAIAELRARPSAHSTAGEDPSLLREELQLHERALRAQEERYATLRALAAEGAATLAEVREAQLAVDAARAAVLRARADMHALQARPARQDETSLELQRLLDQSERLTVRAQKAGRVLDVLATPGEFVTAGHPLVVIGESADPRVIAYAPPDVAPKLRPGSRATIKFPDGTKLHAFVAEQPMLTRRMPADLVDQFGMRPMTVVLHLRADQSWPEEQRIHGLPVTVRFRYDWEPEFAIREQTASTRQ